VGLAAAKALLYQGDPRGGEALADLVFSKVRGVREEAASTLAFAVRRDPSVLSPARWRAIAATARDHVDEVDTSRECVVRQPTDMGFYIGVDFPDPPADETDF